LFHIALLLPSRADLGHWLQHYIDTENQMVGGAGDHLVSEALYLNDPEGNGIELYRDRPRSEWQTSENGHIEMATLKVDIPGVLEAAPKRPFTGLPRGTTMGHIHLQVSTIPESIGFYRGLLGITQTDRQEFSSAAFFGAGGYHHHIGNNIWHSDGASCPPEGSLGLQRFELDLSSSAELSRLLNHLDQNKTQVTTLENDRFAVTDPSGNKVILKS
ncbi:MAG: VOC family protein, partial [Chloroflexota bacterium]